MKFKNDIGTPEEALQGFITDFIKRTEAKSDGKEERKEGDEKKESTGTEEACRMSIMQFWDYSYDLPKRAMVADPKKFTVYYSRVIERMRKPAAPAMDIS